jgi:hypothetical protein
MLAQGEAMNEGAPDTLTLRCHAIYRQVCMNQAVSPADVEWLIGKIGELRSLLDKARSVMDESLLAPVWDLIADIDHVIGAADA